MDVAVIGLGLIGGSLLRALAATGHRVRGFDADPVIRSTAHLAAEQTPSQSRFRVSDTVADAVTHAELVVLAVPLPALPGVLADVTHTGYRALITDVGSVKVPVRDLIRRYGPEGAAEFTGYVGGHPMAGRELSGFSAADPHLFDNCAWVLCLEPDHTVLAAWLDLAALVTSLGARAVPATAAEHDRAVAAVSHVPHLLAASLSTTVADDPLAAALAAGSFRDGTRVAASSPELVAAMCGGNASAVRPALDAVLRTLRDMRTALDGPDPTVALRPLLASGSYARNAWPPGAAEPFELPAQVDELLRLGRAGGWVSAVATHRQTVTAVRPRPK